MNTLYISSFYTRCVQDVNIGTVPPGDLPLHVTGTVICLLRDGTTVECKVEEGDHSINGFGYIILHVAQIMTRHGLDWVKVQHICPQTVIQRGNPATPFLNRFNQLAIDIKAATAKPDSYWNRFRRWAR